MPDIKFKNVSNVCGILELCIIKLCARLKKNNITIFDEKTLLGSIVNGEQCEKCLSSVVFAMKGSLV